jgi:hypothetical protein
VLKIVLWLVGGSIALLALSVVVNHGARRIRIPMGVFAVLMLLNATGHTVGTIVGRSFVDITFSRPMPGFWSSPLMAAAAIYLLVKLQQSHLVEPKSANRLM